MDAVMESIEIMSTSPSDFNLQRDELNRKIDVILTAGQKIDLSSGCTLLQMNIGELLVVPTSTFAVAVLLAAQSENLPDSCVQTFLYQCKLFFSDSPLNREQILSCHKEALVICQKLVHLSQRSGQPRAVTRTLMQAALLLAPEPSILTPIHPLFLQACLSGKMYNLAVDFLTENDILEIDPKNTSLTSQDYLEFFYYGGLCFIGTKKYSVGLGYLLQAVTLPAQALSSVVIAALKTARLVSLIDSGLVFEVPKYASQVVQRFAKLEMPVYDVINNHFICNNIPGLVDGVEAATVELSKDHNLGLAKQVITSRRMHNIRKLTSTYITLPMEDIALKAWLNVKDAESFLLKMVSSGEIHAVIDQQSGMVRFSSDESPASRSQDKIRANEMAMRYLQLHIRDTIAVGEYLRDIQQRVLTSDEYLSRPGGKGFSQGGMTGMGGMAYPDSVGWVDTDLSFLST